MFILEGRQLFEGSDYFKCCTLEVVPQIFCFMIPLNQKIISSLINFQSLNRHIFSK